MIDLATVAERLDVIHFKNPVGFINFTINNDEK